MIINIRHKNDLITLDFQINQIRYLKDNYKTFHEHTQQKDKDYKIKFIDITETDKQAYLFLFDYNRKFFFKSLRDDLFNLSGIKTQLKSFEIQRV